MNSVLLAQIATLAVVFSRAISALTPLWCYLPAGARWVPSAVLAGLAVMIRWFPEIGAPTGTALMISQVLDVLTAFALAWQIGHKAPEAK